MLAKEGHQESEMHQNCLMKHGWTKICNVMAIVSFIKLEERCRITHDDECKESFTTHKELGSMKFRKSGEDVCHQQFSNKFIEWMRKQDEAQPNRTVEDNTKNFTTM